MGIVIMSLIAGTVGTGLGGLFTAVSNVRTDKATSIFLSFAGGVMTSIVFFELIPDALEHSGVAVLIVGLVCGIVLVLLLNFLIDIFSSKKHRPTQPHETLAEFYHEPPTNRLTKPLIRSGMLMFFVIGLHNIPEGLAIGAAGGHDVHLGYTLALMIGLHNVPEGIAISAPLIAGGYNKWKAIVLTLIAGASTVIGTLIGVLSAGTSEIAFAFSFSIAGGAMLYVVFGEIIPQSLSLRNDRIPTVVLLVGIVIGFLLTKI